MGNCVSGQDAPTPQEKEVQREMARINKAITRDLKKFGKEYRATHRLLLLGVLEVDQLVLENPNYVLRDDVFVVRRRGGVREEYYCQADEDFASRRWLY